MSATYPYKSTKMETERRNRILLSVYAYAYEFENTSLVSDTQFDELSKKINIFQETDNKKLDDFFFNKFSPDTGMWIRNHPELAKIKYIYEKHFSL